jgi:hypothetical protein
VNGGEGDLPDGQMDRAISASLAKFFDEQALRETTDLLSKFNKSTRRANHPKSPSSPSGKNILVFRSKKSSYILAIPSRSEGHCKVTNVGRGCGGRGWRS